MDEENVIYLNAAAYEGQDVGPTAFIQVRTEKYGETIMTVADFEKALSLLVGMVHVDIPMSDVKDAIKRTLAIYPYP